MKYQYIRAFIVLLAGLITLIVNMKTGKSVTASLLIVLVVLLVFYVLATLIVEILQHAMENEEQQEADEENDATDMDTIDVEAIAEEENPTHEFEDDDE